MKENILTKVAGFFSQRGRFTILLIVALTTFGLYTYTSILKREGFPVINIPVIVVTTPYFSGDAIVTESKISEPIKSVITQIEGVESIQSTSSDKLSVMVVRLDENYSATEIKEKIIQKVDDLNLEVKPIVVVPNAGLIDGENDLLFSIYSESLSTQELQDKSLLIEEELSKSKLISKVNVKNQYNQVFDFSQNKSVILKNSFARVLINENSSVKGYNALNIGVVKKDSDIGTIDLSEEVQNIVDDILEKEEYKDVSAIYSGDPAISLNKQISSLESNAIAAIITIFVILLLFINLRSAIILALFIPLTLGSVFLVFTILGYTLNTISLFALILVLGLFVDDGTIVVEAIDYYKRKGYNGFESVKMALNDIGVADISGTMTTLLVFMPLTFVTGILGDFIKILPITVILSLFISLVIALTILPYLSDKLIQGKKEKNKNIIEKIFDFVPELILKLTLQAEKLVRWSLSNIKIQIFSFITAIALIAIGGFYATQLSFSFFAPAKDSELVLVSLSFTNLKGIDNVESKAKEVEKLITDKYEKEIESMTYFVANEKSATIRLELNSISQRDVTAREITEVINDKAKTLDNVIVSADIISAGPPVAQYPFAMQIYSEDRNVLETTSQTIADYIRNQELAKDIAIEDVKIEYLSEIRTLDNLRYSEIKVKFGKGNDSSTLIELQDKIEAKFTSDQLGENVKLSFDFGQESDNAESFGSVAISGIASVLVMYALLVLQFNSFTQPILILLAIPFSFPGLFAGLYYTNNPMSFFVVIGLTGLIGIVVNNTIMLIEYANSRRRSGNGLVDAISEAIRLRARPIMTTSLTTIAGLVPLALSEPFWEPLAFTIIFGLISSVIMIIIAFPVFYYLIETIRDWMHKKFKV